MKKFFILFGLLCLVGQKWEPHEMAPFNWRDGKFPVQKHWVIGEVVSSAETTKGKTPWDTYINGKCEERFTYPTDEINWMTPEEYKAQEVGE